MSGKILIVDEVATNRIVLKVKLSAAYYDVHQARTAPEALAMAERMQPDLILASADLSGMDSADFIKAIRGSAAMENVPVVLIQSQNTPMARLGALQAGANVVLAKPIDELILLARLRSILRQRHLEHDLKMHASTATALGFSDAAAGFNRPGRVAIVAGKMEEAAQLRQALAKEAPLHEFLSFSVQGAGSAVLGPAQPDIFVLKCAHDNFEATLRLMAELRAAPTTRNCPIMVLLPDDIVRMAATVLDMGASDVLSGPYDRRELSLRIIKLLEQKKTADVMRDQLHIGLQAAVIDPLTGLYNRRYALPFVSRLIRAARNNGRSFAVMVADLDHFKQVNDQFGHATGDAVLTRVADALRTSLRDEDLIARIGGEEFLIVTPDTSRAQARQTASRLCRIIQNTSVSIPGRDRSIGVTISMGVAMGQIDLNGTFPSLDTLLERADRALYESKSDGRNMVTLSARSAA